MTENTALSLPKENLGVSKFDPKVFEEVSKASSFLPRVQLYGGNSGIVKKGKFPLNHYGLAKSKDDVADLGEEFDAWVITWRPKAMDVSGQEIISVFDHNDDEFKRIVKMSDVQNSGCMFGPEFLMYLPKIGKFATMFFSSKTMRRMSDEVVEKVGSLVTFTVDIIEKGNFVWPGPLVDTCSTPQPTPPADEMAAEKERFENPPKSEVERDEPAEDGGRER